MRGHGDSSMEWESVSRSDVGGDLPALIRHLGGPAVIVGVVLVGRGGNDRRRAGP